MVRTQAQKRQTTRGTQKRWGRLKKKGDNRAISAKEPEGKKLSTGGQRPYKKKQKGRDERHGPPNQATTGGKRIPR